MNIREIAEKCGVSVSTVSRIINDKPDVNPVTRDKVIRVMNEFGFRPSFKISRNDTIGIIMQRHPGINFTGELLIGIYEMSFKLKKTITIISPEDDRLRYPDNIAQFCRVNGLSGVMVVAPTLDSGLPEALLANQIPHVIVASSHPDTDISWVDVDNKNGSAAAVRHLIEGGHRRIALFRGPIASTTERNRVNGYLTTLEQSGISFDENLVFETTDDGLDLVNSLHWIMQMDKRPTGVFCTTHRMSLRVLNAFQSLGYSVPDDISITGFGDYDVSPLLNPPLTSVHQPIYDMGSTAMRIMDEILAQETYSECQVILPTKLMIRKSTRTISTDKG